MIIRSKLKELEHFVEDLALTNPKVSTRSIGWHIDHSLKVIIKTCEIVKKSVPEDYKWQFNFSRFFVFAAGSFPRGRGRAPQSVISEGEILAEDLQIQFEQANSMLDELIVLPEMSNFNHPYFGLLKLKQVVKFLGIHTHHHLKIIRDIYKKESS